MLSLAVLLSMPVLAEDPQLQLTKISARTGIVDIVNAGDGSGRLFLVEQLGRVLIHKDGQELETPFLNIANKVQADGEQGLLSLAFAPDYATSGYFYVWYTSGGGGMTLARFRVSEDADIADPDSQTLVLPVVQPRANHNGGRLQFGPDGMLYLGLGDGGGSGDPDGNGQDGDTLLGKLIRIDVDPVHGDYAVPGDNPFVNDGSVRNEIWALGLRNPWRISFDRGTGDLFIADVGQNRWEEVNFQAASSKGGENYGWNVMEGSQCFITSCDQNGLTLPVAEYEHDQGCSITGGEVYRGSAYPNLVGTYLFGDYCSGNIWGLSRVGGEWNKSLLADTSHRILTFGLGEDGSVYLASQSGGIFLISDGDVVPESFGINAGFNDAWYNPGTEGQGFLISVFPDAEIMFLAWFTYELERPPADVTALLGEPGHRWLTAAGSYSGNTAMLDIDLASGGVFDSGTPEVSHTPDGTIVIEFSDCNSGTLSYDIESANVQGVIPIERVVLDNVALCEALQ
jgi:glucose/arabinose dehydrogenase